MFNSTHSNQGVEDPRAIGATVISVRKTKFSEGERLMYELRFEYSVAGTRYEGRAYDFNLPFSPGDAVKIEYDISSPERSRVPGRRSGWFGTDDGGNILFFPLLAVLIALFGVPRGFRRLRLFRTGKLALGRLVQNEKTFVSVNERSVRKLTFSFKGDLGIDHNTVVKTHLTDALEDDEQEMLLYDPKEPAIAVLLDELPFRPDIAADGSLSSGSLLRPVLTLLLPLSAVSGCLWVWFGYVR